MSKLSLEIERRFLVTTTPRGLTAMPGKKIQQGYLVVDEQREVRIRKAGRSCYLTVKEGSGLVRKEQEIHLTAQQFEALWPMTEGRRIEKTRYKLKAGEHTVEVDRFRGSLLTLCIAEVEFASVQESEAFSPPDYCAEEITGRNEFKNAQLALSGLPHADQNAIRVAALPYLFRNGELHVVLVSNKGGNKWILPKGHQEDDMPRGEVALMEAVEEAGIIGVLTDGLRGRCNTTNQQIHHVYPVKVSTLLKKWPESGNRRRRVLPLQKALAKLHDPQVAKCVERMAEKLDSL